MMTRVTTVAASVLVLIVASSGRGGAQQFAEPKAILARAHGTFVDARGGGGVLSGDTTVTGFEVRAGVLVAMGTIEGSLADSAGTILGQVDQAVTLPVRRVVSTCNQLSVEVGGVDVNVLGTQVHLDEGVAGFDSRDGGVPRSLDALCRVADAVKGKPVPSVLAASLNDVVHAISAKRAVGPATRRRVR